MFIHNLTISPRDSVNSYLNCHELFERKRDCQ